MDGGRLDGSAPLFVGRGREIDDILRLLATSPEGVVVDVVGVRGAGKSALLSEVAHEIGTVPGAVARASDRQNRPDGHRGERGVAAGAAVHWHTFNEAVNLMETLIGTAAADRRAFAAIQELVDQSDVWKRPVEVHNALSVGRRSTAAGLTVSSDVVVATSEAELIRQIQTTQRRLDDTFVELWRTFTRNRPVLLTVDSFERSVDDEFGAWLLRFALRLPRTVVVTARTPSDVGLPLQSTRLHQHWLANFTVDEVRTYLQRRLLGEPVADDVVQLAHDFTNGLPGGVLLLGELLNERGPATVTAAALRRTLATMPADVTDNWAKLVDEILTTVPERSAVRAAAVVTAFDERLVAELLGVRLGGAPPDGVAPNDGPLEATRTASGAAINALRRRRLLRPVTMPADPLSAWYQLHEFIRQSVLREMRADEAGTLQLLHTRAAAHYFALLQADWEAERDGGYLSWYKYEDLNWQWHKRQWLRHEGHLTGQRERTRARFARIFLEAFWWWGLYHPFPFNRDLVDDWDNAIVVAVGDRDEAFRDSLLFLLNHYPTGYDKPSTAPWGDIADRLRLLHDLCGLDVDRRRLPPDEAENAGATTALIDLFLAHTARYADPHSRSADQYYDRARAGFDTLGDRWTVAWLDQERADLALVRGQLDEVQPLIEQAARAAATIGEDGEGWDHELLANLHRIQADLAWSHNLLAEAGARYGRAAADAYWFQGDEHPPDAYTQAFYDEMLDRTSRRLADLAARHDRPALLAFVEALTQNLPRPVPGGAPAGLDLVEGDPTDLLGRLLPAGPLPSELGSADAPFMMQWRRDRGHRPAPADSLRPLLSSPGDDPLPSV